MDTYLQKGLSEFSSKKYFEAIKTLTNYINKNRNDASGFFNRGRALSAVYEYKKALLDFNVAVELLPDFCSAYLERSRINFLLGNYDDAVEDLSIALRINSENADILIMRAELYYNIGKIRNKTLYYRKSGEDINNAMRIDSSCSDKCIKLLNKISIKLSVIPKEIF